jgi:hypothetical protein
VSDIYTETDIYTDTETDSYTETETDIYTDTVTDIYTDTETKNIHRHRDRHIYRHRDRHIHRHRDAGRTPTSTHRKQTPPTKKDPERNVSQTRHFFFLGTSLPMQMHTLRGSRV